MDPRIRDRRATLARRHRRRRLWLLGTAAVVAALAAGGWFLLHSRFLSARVVTVVGSVHTPVPQVVAAAGLAGRPPLLDVDPGASAAAVERLPWVATATVSRRWPDGVRITVVERVPVAAEPGAAGGTWAVVDRSGRVVATAPAPPAGLVHLAVAAHPGVPGSSLGPSATPALGVAATLPPAFASQVVEVDGLPAGLVDLKLTSPLTVVLGPATDLSAKYEDVASLLAGATLHVGDVIDVSVPDAPTVTGP